MRSSFRKTLVTAVGIIGLAVALLPETASAAANDAKAGTLADRAINEEYLGTEFDKALKTLDEALKLCGSNQCAPATVARIHRDRGVVLVAGKADAAGGKTAFVAALTADPAVKLDPDLSTPEVQAAYDAAKAEVPAAAALAAATPATPATTGGPIVHQPPSEQAVNTPVPLFVKVNGLLPTAVRVLYQPFGTASWKTLQLAPMDGGYSGLIPCADVGTVVGNLKYYIQVMTGETVAAAQGSDAAPLQVSIKTALSGPPPALPGQQPPAACKAAATDDCPPDFPGCGTEDKEQCIDDSDCSGGNSCVQGYCQNPDEVAAAEEDSGPSLRTFVGIQQDFLMLPASDSACGSADYTCFFSNGDQIPGDQQLSDQTQGGRIGGGFVPATTRILLGADYLITPSISLGGSVGFAFGGAPKSKWKDGAPFDGASFMPLHLEGRGSYWFAKPGKGFFGNGNLAAGLAQVDGGIAVKVQTTNGAGEPKAWNKAGNIFAALGGTFGYGFTETLGAHADLRVGGLFGTSGTFASLGLGVDYMF